MNDFFTSWNHPDFAAQPVGGKARALGRLCAAGFEVPQWVVVTPDQHARFFSGGVRDRLATAASYEEARASLDISIKASPELTAEITQGLQAALPGVTSFAVRSSASDEDGQQHSFAGQLESFLEVSAAEVAARIVEVWRSGFSERIYFYRAKNGLSLPPPIPAVIVQEMVAAEASGVAFSADPVSGRSGIAVVGAVRGLGEKLVSGEVNSDNFEVERAGKITKKTLAEETSTAAAITDGQAAEVAALARRAAAYFGMPQDIEWAIAAGKLYLLQSRPITSLAGRLDPDGAYQLWDNSNIAESYAGVTTPLTFSFARHVYEEVYRQFVRILCVPTRRIERERDTFGRMLGLVRGRVFYNLLSWYRVLAMLPGFTLNRQFMEQMMGVKKPLPDEIVAEIVEGNRTSWSRDWLDVLGTARGLWWTHWTLRSQVRDFFARIDRVLAPPEVPLAQQRADELAAHFRYLQRELLVRWDAPLANDFFAMIYYGLLGKLVTKWCGDADGSLQNNLIAGQGGIISEEPARRLIAMAEMASKRPAIIEALEHGTWPCIREALAADADLREALDSYLEKFGDRCLEELKLETITLGDDPLLLARSIGQLARRQAEGAPRGKPVDLAALVAEAERRVEEALGSNPIRAAIFHHVLRHARERVRDRENLRFERTRVFGRVRRVFVELGKRLHAAGVLDDPRDVFYLAYEEVLGFVEGHGVSTRLRETSRLRKEEYAEYQKTPAPGDRFETFGMPPIGNAFLDMTEPMAAVDEKSDLKGIGCCPGIVRGLVRVILDPRSAALAPGEILVAPRTDPGWITLFPAASALLVEYGSLLSHSAIVAREMGLPAIVSIPHLTKRLRTGDLVEMDGARGLIRIITRAPGDA